MTRKRPMQSGFILLLALLLVPPLLAQRMSDRPVDGHPGLPEPEFGTSSDSTVSVFSYAFQSYESGATYMETGNAYRWFTTGTTKLFIAEVSIPSGVTITRLGFNYCDSNPGGDWFVVLYDSFGDNGFATIATIGPTDRIGCGYVYTPTLAYEFDANQGHLLSIYAFQPNITDGSVNFRGAEVAYRRKVSPAPATATFADVPVGAPQHRFVEALVAAGITAGCGGGNYCPNNPVTRGQMAVFLAAALGLHFPN